MNKNISHRTYLNIQCLVGGALWGMSRQHGLVGGSEFLEAGFESLKTRTISSLLLLLRALGSKMRALSLLLPLLCLPTPIMDS